MLSARPRLLLPLLIVLLLACLTRDSLGFGGKPFCSIRFYVVGNQQDGPSFVTPMSVGNPPRTIFVNKVAAVSESDVASVYPFAAADGTYGCGLRLDFRGTIRLDTVSAENRGTPLVCMVNGRLITAMLIDKQIKDGVLFIPSGLTAEEVKLITRRFPVMGQGKAAKSALPAPRDSRGD
jgi:hypothetical protein